MLSDDLLYPSLGCLLAKYILVRSITCPMLLKVEYSSEVFPEDFVGLRETSPKSSLGIGYRETSDEKERLHRNDSPLEH